jgi:hypothetical protein
MATVIGQRSMLSPKLEPILSQGRIEKCFPSNQACTEREHYARLDAGRQPADDGLALIRGIATGTLAERELLQFATEGRLTVDLAHVAAEILSSIRRPHLPADRLPEVQRSMVAWVRRWQAAFPPRDGDRDWMEVTPLLDSQHDLFVRRPGRFAIRVRPDNIVGVGDTLIAVEWSTARAPSSVSPARIALNHHALLRERLRQPEWQRYSRIATRVEMLALGEGYTRELEPDEAESWREQIGEAAEALVDGRHEPNRGPWCSTCFWQSACWFGGDASNDSF